MLTSFFLPVFIGTGGAVTSAKDLKRKPSMNSSRSISCVACFASKRPMSSITSPPTPLADQVALGVSIPLLVVGLVAVRCDQMCWQRLAQHLISLDYNRRTKYI